MIYYVHNSLIMLASGASGLGTSLHRRLYNLVCMTMDCLLYQCVVSCNFPIIGLMSGWGVNCMKLPHSIIEGTSQYFSNLTDS